MSLAKLYEKHQGDVQFLSIYIREAHPIEGWWLGKGIAGAAIHTFTKAATDVHDPTTIEERRAVAQRCNAALEYGVPTLVDDLDDSVNKAYAAWPTRLYLIGTDGLVLYESGPGPWGFKPAKLGQAIEAAVR